MVVDKGLLNLSIICPYLRCGEVNSSRMGFLPFPASFIRWSLRMSEMRLAEGSLRLVTALTAYSAHIQRGCRGTWDRAGGQQASVHESTSAIEGELLWEVTAWILNESPRSTSTESMSSTVMTEAKNGYAKKHSIPPGGEKKNTTTSTL